MAIRSVLLGAVVLGTGVALAGCATTPDPTVESSAPSASAAPGGNGTVFTWHRTSQAGR